MFATFSHDKLLRINNLKKNTQSKKISTSPTWRGALFRLIVIARIIHSDQGIYVIQIFQVL